MTQALIYCAGVGQRWARGWPDDCPKQLVEVDGERLLDRTVAQLRRHDIAPIVVGFDPRLSVEHADYWTPPHPTRWLAETIEHSATLWQNDTRTIGLFGDVWFSDWAIDQIAGSKRICFFGRYRPSVLTGGPGEVFGFAWDREDSSVLLEHIRAGVADAEEKDTGAHGAPTEPGSIWQPYRRLCGFDMYDHRTDDRYWCEINDWTDDFDTPGRYAHWMAAYRRRWIKDSG